MILDLTRLRAFREVATRGSFSRAADALDYTQPAISHQVSTLERDLGLTLIERAARPVRVTEAGEALLLRTDAIFGEVAAAEAQMRSLAGLESGKVRLAGFTSACATVLPQAVARFIERYPELTVELAEMQPPIATRMVRSGEVDLAVIYAYGDEALTVEEGLEAVPLAREPFVVALPEGHRLAGRRAVRLTEMKHERWVGAPPSPPGSGFRDFLVRTCREAGFEADIAFEPSDIWTGRGIVASGLAVGIFPRIAFTFPHPGVVVKPLRGRPPIRQIAAVRATERQVPAVAPMLECVTAVFGD